ncbi:hypothetical protein [Levilactobacillus zymae]|uniref:hypothetical protein n=1 Tax=Levilactobacillus zymae TaxID=267363 RepID=UPI0028BB6DFA|nr:hypothetical protein [Levilactobacillus zymae]MDT6981192.1 hypothetical protein [Levilactobacillus zymae]
MFTAAAHTATLTAQLALANRVATPENTPDLLAAFQKSSWYELNFWQMALDHEDWHG